MARNGRGDGSGCGTGRIGGLAVDPSDPTYAKAEEALVVKGTLVEPVLPAGLATIVVGGGTDLTVVESLVATVLESDDSVPSIATVEVVGAATFDNDGDVDGRDFLVWQRGGSLDPDADSGDYLIWQRQLGSHSRIDTADLAQWRQNFGQTYATIDTEAWLGGLLPEVDDRILLDPPDDRELIGFEVQQQGKVRGALLWEVGDTEIVTHLWATAALEPLVEPTETLTLVHVGLWESVPAFYEDVVLTLEADPIATYEQGTELVVKSVKPR